jgi:hypothetical protein
VLAAHGKHSMAGCESAGIDGGIQQRWSRAPCACGYGAGGDSGVLLAGSERAMPHGEQTVNPAETRTHFRCCLFGKSLFGSRIVEPGSYLEAKLTWDRLSEYTIVFGCMYLFSITETRCCLIACKGMLLEIKIL